MMWIVLALLPTLAPAKEVRVGFNEIKALVETQNERVQAGQLEAEASRKRGGHLTRSFLPSLEAHAAQETFEVGTRGVRTQPDYGVEASINIFNGGRDRLRNKVLGTRAERKSFEVRATLADELAKARELYWYVLYREYLHTLLKEMAEINATNLAAARRRIKSGVATESDRLEFEMSTIELKREIQENEIELRSASRDLLVRLGQSPHDKLITQKELTHENEWEIDIKHTHQDHEFLVKPSELLSEEAELAARQASREWMPKVDAYAGWYQFNQREEEPDEARERQEQVVGIRVKMSVFDGLNSQAEASAQRREAAAAKSVASYQRKLNEAHVEREFDELKLLHDRVHEADANIKSAQTYYRITQSEYNRGVKNSPDVLGASEKLFAMKHKRLEMIRDFHIARSHVLSKLGK